MNAVQVLCERAPQMAAVAAGPVRWANLFRHDRSWWVTVFDDGNFPRFRLSFANEEEANEAVRLLSKALHDGLVLPRQTFLRRVLPPVNDGPSVLNRLRRQE
jgi:hypothetical protein